MECCRICRYILDWSFPLHQSYSRSAGKRSCLFFRQTLLVYLHRCYSRTNCMPSLAKNSFPPKLPFWPNCLPVCLPSVSLWPSTHLQFTVSFPCSSSSINHRSLFRTSPFFVVFHLFNFHSFIHFVIPSLTYLLSVITVISLNLHSIDCPIPMMAADSSALLFDCLSPRSFLDQFSGWHGAQNTPQHMYQPGGCYGHCFCMRHPRILLHNPSFFFSNDDLNNCK